MGCEEPSERSSVVGFEATIFDRLNLKGGDFYLSNVYYLKAFERIWAP